jgi:hypothetical protein
VDQAEFVGSVASVRVTVERARLSVGGPTGVSHRSLGDEGLSHVDDSDVGRLLGVGLSGLVGRLIGIRGVLGDQFTKTGDLSNLLEEDGRGFGRVAVDTDTCGVKDLESVGSPCLGRCSVAYRQSRIHGIQVERDHCKGLRRCASCPFHTSMSSTQRFLDTPVEI